MYCESSSADAQRLYRPLAGLACMLHVCVAIEASCYEYESNYEAIQLGHSGSLEWHMFLFLFLFVLKYIIYLINN